MPRYTFEIEAGDGFPDQLDTDLPDREAARMHAIDLATARLETQDRTNALTDVRIIIKDETGDVLDIIRSVAD